MRIPRLRPLAALTAVFVAVFAFAAFPLPPQPQPQPGDEPAEDLYKALKQEAETFYAEGSYAYAHQFYEDAKDLTSDAAERRWIAFRLADTLWRSSSERSEQESARGELEELTRPGNEDPDERDRVWIEGRESLGDFFWTRQQQRNWGQAWPHYQAALDAWGGHRDLALARERYLTTVWKITDRQQDGPHAYYGFRYNFLPLEVLDNVLRIARSADERARAHYLIAMTVKLQGNHQQQHRVTREFEAALAEEDEGGGRSSWHDDALFHYAEWLSSWGRRVYDDSGTLRQEQDFLGAAELYRRLLEEYKKGETAYHDSARQSLDQITGTQLGVYLSQVFLPGSEVEYNLSWRNARRIELALYSVDLSRYVEQERSLSGWQQRLDVTGLSPQDTWTFDTGDRGEHQPGQRALRLESLAPGAYVVLARDADSGKTAQELLLVTDAAIVVRTSGAKTLVYACNALDGSPLPHATLRVQEHIREGNEWSWRGRSLTTGDDGLAVYEGVGRQLLVTAAAGDRQAFAASHRNYNNRQDGAWRLYAFTDRPAYRPGETTHFKVVVRRDRGGVLVTPAGATVRYEIIDPRGSKVAEADLSLNDFGSAWAELELTSEMPLGVYRVHFKDANRGIGSAELFRLEEYKLPELRVSVKTPEEDGRRKTFRTGETVEVEVLAEYYFGGAVTGADVQLLIHQKNFYSWWSPPRPFPWFYANKRPYGGHGHGPGQLLEQKAAKTDAEGRARFTFETPQNLANDFEYTVEARVVDSSRREVTGTGTVRVTRQSYYAYPRSKHNLYRPGDRVSVDVKTIDANDEPIPATGTMKVTRDRWQENAYEHQAILERIVKTDSQGHGELQFEAAEEGYYRVTWIGQDGDAAPVRAETTVWVATRESRHLGYHHTGVEIVVDRDTFRAGETAPVMLSTAVSGRWVLLSIEGEELIDYRLVHLEGTVKLLTLEVDDRYVPNVFLQAILVEDGHLAIDTEEIVVPPVDHFLEVEVISDREVYEPREKGTLTITTRDHNGRPVAAEVALAFVDEAIFAIQDDLAGDPRQFFYGDKRHSTVRTSSSFDQRPYGRLAKQAEPVGGVGQENEAVFMDTVGASAAAPMMEGKMVARAAFMSAPAPSPPAPSAPAPVLRGKKAAQTTPAVQVRSDFRATALWRPDVVTDDDGKARLEVTFPDSLTSWKATARANAQDSRFGIAKSSARTRMPLIVRLQAPRFFVVGDRVTVSAVLNNNTDKPMRVTPDLEAEGLVLTAEAKPVLVPAKGEVRVDYRVVAETAGTARLTASGRALNHADAMRKEYVVYEHGLTQRITQAGKMRGDETTVTLELPSARRETRFEVRLAPSLATTMLDALPYLIDYPYGCTEQTMSRFLPAVITAKTLADLGLDPAAIEGRVFGGVEALSQEKTHPDGKKDLGELDAMTKKGLARLYDFQHGDGGWGWWKEGDSDHFMTAYVVWGLALARQAGIAVDSNVDGRGVSFLEKEIVEAERQGDLQAWMLHALGRHHALGNRGRKSPATVQALDNLWNQRDGLSSYSRALLAIAAHDFGDGEKARVLVRNLENGAVRDQPEVSVVAPGASQAASGASHTQDGSMETVHWGQNGFYWRWRDGPVESTAFVLQALQTIDPEHRLIEPAMSWLVKNRRGAQWSNTRDTAITVLALNDYLRRSGELASDQEVELFVNDKRVATHHFDADDVLAAPGRFEVDTKHLRDGGNEIRIVRRGEGALYFSAQAEYVNLEEPVEPAGHEIFVRRSYSKLAARPTLLKGIVYDKIPLASGDTVKSGERVEVVLTVEVKNDYEYLIFEDLKPAGFEAVEVKSGGPLWAQELDKDAEESVYTNRRRWVYQEFRDRKVALFVDKLPQGIWQLRYELRAEVPGEFHALPVTAQAMYVPEIRGNGREIRVTVVDQE